MHLLHLHHLHALAAFASLACICCICITCISPDPARRFCPKKRSALLGRLTQENTRHKRRILHRRLRCAALPDIQYAHGSAPCLCTKCALFWCEADLPKGVRDKIGCKNFPILTYGEIFSGSFSRIGTGKTVCFLMSVGLCCLPRGNNGAETMQKYKAKQTPIRTSVGCGFVNRSC